MGDGDYFDFSRSVFHGPVTGVAAPSGTAATPPPPPPSTLQAPPAFFTGRDSEVEELLALLAPPDEPAAQDRGACALSGLGGVGKTALALHTAHIARTRAWFPGGTLFADLRGYDDTPMSADRAVTLLLEMLGLRDAELPQSPEAQFARYRSELADRPRMLIVLDNVSDPRQIWPLLPGEGTDHRVLITSRDVQDSLPMRQLTVATLSPQAAQDFIDRSLRHQDPDDHRVADEPDAVRDLAELCGHLPLALSIGAALLQRRRQRPIATLTAELRDAADRLRALSTKGVDQYGKDLALRPVFDVMYERLEPRLARVLRLIAQAPADVVGLGGAMALSELPQQKLESALEDLVACSLLVPVRPFRSHGCWQMHDLVRLYAQNVVENDSSLQSEATRARMMLTAYYWQTLQSALALIWGPPIDDAPDVFTGDRSLALAWCNNERADLLSVSLWVLSDDEDEFTCASVLAEAFTNYLKHLRHRRAYQDVEIVARAVLAAAARRHLRSTEGSAWEWLGQALDGLRRLDEALDCYDHAERIGEELGDLAALADVLANRGATLCQSGRYEEGIAAQTRALRALDDLGRHRSAAQCQLNLAQLLTLIGRLSEAHGHLTQCLPYFTRTGDRVAEATSRRWLGTLLGKLGRFEEGVNAHALGLCAELGDWHGRAAGWGNLGGLWADMGRHEDAVKAHMRARDWFASLDDHHQEAIAWSNLSGVLTRLGRQDEALRAAHAARDLLEASGDFSMLVFQLNKIGEIHQSAGRRPEARAALTAAVAVAKRAGLLREDTEA
ncbi:tetratricopeptide repeat protein [Streptomyces sp. NPDC088350]|uniref:tetratricopeptide repeat protein n=1 Tax=Streptomyces sp. NPDC088350 TaxID=3365854 RepID=UPI003812C891